MHPQKVFITGASSGIGEALARHYADRGAIVALFARREIELARVAAALAAPAVVTYAGDVRDAAALAAAGSDFIARHGVPDIVIANAGVSRGTLTEHAQDIDAFRAVFDTNVMGMVNTFAPFAAAMQRARAGALVGIASVAGFRGLAGSGAYSASKAAAITYLESLRLEMRPFDVAVVTICPGYVATPMTAHNPYRMPFLMRADVAAARMARAIAGRRRFYVLPWPMALAGHVLRALPRPLYDAMFAGAARKPRVADVPPAD
jgi:short-subunit dehydrogenase